MTFLGHIVVSCHCLLWPQRLNAERMNIAAVELTKWLLKRYLWAEEGHAVKCHNSWKLKKTQPLILTQQTELWFNNCSAQSMRNTTVHFPHLWHCNICYKVLVCRHVKQLLGGCLQGFMDKSSCGFDKGFRAALILQPSKQHKKRRHTGSLGRVCCYVSSGPFWSKHPWRGSSSMMPHLQYGVNMARWMNIKWFLHFFCCCF